MDYKIRTIRASDNKDIYQLNKRLGHEYDEEKVYNHIQNILGTGTDIIMVVEKNEKVVGYVHGCPYNTLYADSLCSIVALVFTDNWLNDIAMYYHLVDEFESIVKINGYSGIRMSADAERERLYDFMLDKGYENKMDLKHYIKFF